MAIFERILKGFPYMNIDIYYQVVGREDYHIDKQRIRLTRRKSRGRIGGQWGDISMAELELIMCTNTYSYR